MCRCIKICLFTRRSFYAWALLKEIPASKHSSLTPTHALKYALANSIFESHFNNSNAFKNNKETREFRSKKKVTKTSKKLEVKRSAKCWHNIVQKLLTTAIRKKATKKSKSSLKTDKSTYNHRIYLEKIAKNRQIY